MSGYNPYAPPSQDPAPLPVAVGGPAGAPVPWTIGEVLNVGYSSVKQRPLELIGGYFVVVLLSQLPGIVPLVLTSGGVVVEGSLTYYVLQALVSLIGMVVGSFMSVGAVRVALAAARQQPFEFGLFFSGGDRLVPMIVLSIVSSLGILAGTLLLIVPGIILALGWALAAPLLVDAGCSPIEALRESWEAMRGNKLQLLLFGAVALLVSIAGLCACYVGVLVVIPILAVAYAEIYRRVTGRMLGSGAASVGQPVPAPAGGFGPEPSGSGWMSPPRSH